MQLLICGIPGTGKTTAGDFLRDRRGFVHVDLENHGTLPEELRRGVDELGLDTALPRYLASHPEADIVVTWGFQPEYRHDLAVVDAVLGAGLPMVWFDGDRAAARRAFKRRGGIPAKQFDLQVERIDRTGVVGRYRPLVLNPFRKDGGFKSRKKIARKLLALAAQGPAGG